MVREPILGIDLGTTNSCVAVVEGGKPVVVRNSEGYNTTPSVVAFNNQGERLVGHVAKRQAITNPERTISSVKRLMGTKEKIEIDHRTFTPEQISAIILQKIKKQAQDYLGTRVNKAIITVPAYFDDAQRLATRHAGQIAGLEVVRIINEPTASALTYGLTRADKELNLIVFDFGGGTFDVTILQLAEQVLHVRATSGNNRLGGDDFDQRVMDWIATRFQSQWGYDLSGNSVAMQRIKEAAEQAKIELSGRSAAEIQLPFLETVDGVPMHFQESLSINEFNKLTADLVKQVAGPIGVALGDAKMQVNDIDRVILVGGTTRIPAVQDFIRNFFEKDPVKSVNPDEAVAIGAAIQGGILTGEIDEMLLLDVVPMTMSIEVGGNKIARIFPRNTQIPASTTKTLTTSRDGQRSVHVHVVQGESEAASENKSLARVDVTEIPPAEARAHQISVTFEIDADGIFSVSAKDAATGEARPIVMTRTHGLTPERLAELASESARQAEKERLAEERTAATINAQSTLQSAQRLLERTADRLPEFKQGVVHECIRDLREAVMNGSTDDIARRAEELETIVTELWKLQGGEPSVSSV